MKPLLKVGPFVVRPAKDNQLRLMVHGKQWWPREKGK